MEKTGISEETAGQSRTARHLTNFPGCPAVLQADFHCQNGWRNGLASGQVDVVHWILPSAFSIDLEERPCPQRGLVAISAPTRVFPWPFGQRDHLG